MQDLTSVYRIASPRRHGWPLLGAVLLLAALFVPMNTQAQGTAGDTADDAAETVELGKFLVLSSRGLPAFSPDAASADAKEAEHEAAEVLDQRLLSMQPDGKPLWPAEGDRAKLPGSGEQSWRRANGLPAAQGDGAQLAYLAAYVEAERFSDAKLTVTSHHPLRVYLDGEQVAEKKSSEAADADAGSVDAELPLTTGKHLLLLQVAYDADAGDWYLDAQLESPHSLTTSTDPAHALRLTDVLDRDDVTNVSVSADGAYLALSLRNPAVPAEHGETWMELRRTDDGSRVRTLHESANFQWLPEGHQYSYVRSNDDKSTLWLASVEGGDIERVLHGVENMGFYAWLPDASGVIFSINQEEEKNDLGAKRYRHPNDRWSGWRGTSSLHHAVRGGGQRPLTQPHRTLSFADISPDGTHLLLGDSRVDPTRRPFNDSTLYELDLATLESRELTTITWVGSSQYSPDGKKLLITGAPTAFGDIGINVPEGVLPNEYDSQAYIYDLASGEVDPITRDFDPSLIDTYWSHGDANSIYLRVTEGPQNLLYRYDIAARSFERLDVGLTKVDGMAIARKAPVLAGYGSGLEQPEEAFLLDLSKAAASKRHIWGPATDLSDIRLGKIEPWDFETEDGTIVGRVHYPPNFDPAKKYPLLVYYYGGTAPVEREFAGRYPKSLWSAHGYLVYVLQPSGTYGFGQEFAARHVNNWGKTVIGEIVKGVETFLEQHPYADADAVGCLGASYGGFMTDLLLASSDVCKAGISHAGISDLTNYWGHGWWGWLYNAAAAADSYPWNRRDLYVDQSAVYHADKITAPLLLLHGAADNNVPPGQSETLYTALSVLGRDVEFITFDGEGHQIFNYKPRVLWAQTIIAWFDRHLKKQPEYWQHLWGTPEEPKG